MLEKLKQFKHPLLFYLWQPDCSITLMSLPRTLILNTETKRHGTLKVQRIHGTGGGHSTVKGQKRMLSSDEVSVVNSGQTSSGMTARPSASELPFIPSWDWLSAGFASTSHSYFILFTN